ncbi:DNA cytosine methyltransferase [Streptomyces sp. NPDC059904]|uniref:DNA cytosine methyltransferase n=1 Tax=Streptomyces sp. NPDC059904 TaxID=3346996 RepID=UPI0036693EB7
MSLRIASFCSGFGGLEMAVKAAFGGEVVFHADPDEGASKILAHHWPTIPNLGDITALDWAAVAAEHGPIDIAAMGFPCTDVSLAGRGAGIAPDTRSGLWNHCAAGIQALNPRFVVIENVRGLLSRPAHCDLEPCPWCVGDGDVPVLRALGAVLGDLADRGFDAEWIGLPASDPAIGSCHERWREIILAWRADADPDDLRRDRGAGDVGEAQRRHEPAHSSHPAAPAGDVTLLPTPAARDWKSGASNLMDTNSRPLNEFAVNWLPRRGDWVGTNGVDYGPAIRQWEQVMGRPAPEPTITGPRGGIRLNPAFPEWMQGLAAGHVTAVPDLSYEDQLRAIGNGVVWQQGAHALRVLQGRAVHSLHQAAA